MTDNLKNAFKSFPLTDTKEVDDKSNVSIPTEQGVEDAKEWVDEKEM